MSAARSRLGARRLALAVAAVIVLLDQLTKWWALEALDDGRIIDVVWTLRFNLVFNEGMSFSLGQGLGWLVGVVGIGVVGVLVAWAGRIESTAQRVALGAVLGGAIGNLVDRIFRADDGPLSGAVVDFVDFQWWPVFNVADMALVVGVIALVVLLAIEDQRGGAPAAEPDGGPGAPAPDPATSEASASPADPDVEVAAVDDGVPATCDPTSAEEHGARGE